MSVPIAYITVAIIWSTTPLMVVWSSADLPPLWAVTVRMSIAVLLGLPLLYLLGIKFSMSQIVRRSYFAGGVGIFGAMSLTYIGASYVDTGLISLIFGFSPMISGCLGHRVLGEQRFSLLQWIALFVALMGLLVVSFDADLLHDTRTDALHTRLLGSALLLTAVVVFSISTIAVKHVAASVHPLSQAVGSLLYSLPGLWVVTLLFASPVQWLSIGYSSILAILYLALLGSLLAYMAYFYVLERIPVARVNLITLITPVFAILLGVFFNAEQLSLQRNIGCLLVLSGLGVYLLPSIMPRLSNLKD